MQFKDKVVLITGAAGGIGAAAARKFAGEGAKLALVDLKQEALEREVGDIAGALLIAADVSSEDEVAAYVEKTVAHYGRIDVFLNNAGINGDWADITEQSITNLTTLMNVNVIGVALGLKHVVAQMRSQEGGAIVNTASNAGLMGAPGMAGYAASKHAVIGINKSVALEVAGQNIRVNAVCPSGVDTQMVRAIETNASGGADDVSDARAQFENSVPLGRYAEPEEIADVMAYLASDQSSFIHGAYVRVDGGGAAASV